MSQLRSFSAYNKNANAGVNLIARQCTLSNIDGNYIVGVAGQYFQIHNKATAPIATEVPVRSYYLPNAGPVNLPSLFQELGPVPLSSGLGVAISTTEAILTLGVGTFDVFGEIEEYELPITGLTTITALGNALGLTSAIDYLLWNDASGPQFLYEFTLVNNESVTVYPMLFTTDAAPSGGAIPIVVLPGVADGATRLYPFGDKGFSPSDKSGTTTRDGCHLVMSSSASSYSVVGLAASATTILTAKFKAS